MRTADASVRLRFAAALGGVLCVVALSLSASGRAIADGPNRAGIVVSFGDGRVESVCVEFTETEISGAELMNRAGFSVLLGSGGDTNAVCMIEDTGCRDPADCWCQCHGADCRYWSYHTLDRGAWKYSAVGASTRKVHNGDVDGWAWGKGGVGSGAEPDPITFEELCSDEGSPPPVTPPPAAPTMPQVAPTETAVEVATAPLPPPTATVTGQTPPATMTKPKPTSFPISRLPTEVAETAKEDAGSGLPWQLPAFAVLAAGLLGTAVVVAKRRSGG